MSKRRSIASGFGLVSSALPSKSDERASGDPKRGAKGKAPEGFNGESERLKTLSRAASASVIDIDASLVDPSPFQDRMPDDEAEDIAGFIKTISDEGQKVPIQIRPHPQARGRYQIVYGHRRLAAARKLGIAVKALITEMTDRELVIVQGIENSERKDLSWIERALFAVQMDKAGLRARDIYAALSIDDAELARIRGVCRAIPENILRAVGRAPKIGRPRWVALAEHIKNDRRDIQNLAVMLSSDGIRGMSSDQRFAWLSGHFAKQKEDRGTRQSLRDADGLELGEVRQVGKDLHIVAANQRGRAFADYVRERLPELLEAFSASRR